MNVGYVLVSFWQIPNRNRIPLLPRAFYIHVTLTLFGSKEISPSFTTILTSRRPKVGVAGSVQTGRISRRTRKPGKRMLAYLCLWSVGEYINFCACVQLSCLSCALLSSHLKQPKRWWRFWNKPTTIERRRISWCCCWDSISSLSSRLCDSIDRWFCIAPSSLRRKRNRKRLVIISYFIIHNLGVFRKLKVVSKFQGIC